MRKIIFASKNKGKVDEVKYILSDLNVHIISLDDINESIDIEENGSSFEENAMIKAKQVFEKFRIPTIADDSGLVVEQLNDEPGIYSARYAGEPSNDRSNNIKLIEKLKHHPEPHLAKFVCAAVYYDGENNQTAVGVIKGRIIGEERGNNGFGYDPLFIPDGYSITSAEMEPKLKNKISHRFNAFNKLKELIG